MDMKVDSKLIRSWREQRAWSQEHLAEVSGLGLRTIQRIESTGNASYESARALAAVLELDVARLRVAEPSARQVRGRRVWLRRPIFGALAAAAAILAAVLVARTGFADQVLLDVGLSLEAAGETREWKTQMIVEEGAVVPDVNDLRFEELRLVIVPMFINETQVRLDMTLYERRGDTDVLISRPALITAEGEEAGIGLARPDARTFRLSITPRRYFPSLL